MHIKATKIGKALVTVPPFPQHISHYRNTSNETTLPSAQDCAAGECLYDIPLYFHSAAEAQWH